MHYEEFKLLIHKELLKHPAGLTWDQIRDRLALPYERPSQTWIMRMEREIGLLRVREKQRTFVWKISEAGQES